MYQERRELRRCKESMKRVYLEAGWKPNPLYDELVSCPPQGYEFVVGTSPLKRRASRAAKNRAPWWLMGELDKIAPLALLRARIESLRRVPPDTDLVYSCGMLVYRRMPWVADHEYISLLVGGNIAYFSRYKAFIERAFASQYCKRIVCWSEVGKKVVLSNMDCGKFQDKLEVVYFAIRKKGFHKEYRNGKVKLLFVGSANLPGEFRIKGGVETLEAFLLLRQRYPQIELVIRSDVPPDIKAKYGNIEDLTIIDTPLPRERLEQEWKTADIFVLPTRVTPFGVFLDAMTYELPIVTTDVWGNAEMVEDGKTGFLLPKSDVGRYITDSVVHLDSLEFQRAVERTDPDLVEALVEKLSLLIEDRELRRAMGKAGRRQVEQGKFSIEKRNQYLKTLFDEATA